MKLPLAMLGILTVAGGRGPAQEIDRGRVRQAITMPAVTVHWGYQANTRDGFALVGKTRDAWGELAALRKAIRGDASDAERHDQIGDLLSQLGEKAASQEAYTRAVDLYRQRVQARPDDGNLRSRFATALNAVGRHAEAEKEFQRAVEAAPDDWRCWAAQGESLLCRHNAELFGDRAASINLQGSGQAAVSESLKSVSRARLEVMEPTRKKALACLDKAVALAPSEAGPYRKRLVARVTYLGVALAMRSDLKGRSGPELMGALLTPELMDDLRQVARFSPRDTTAIGAGVGCEFVLLSVRSAKGADEAEVNRLRDQLRKSLEQANERLSVLLKDKDRHVAADAAEVTAFLCFLIGEKAAAEQWLRRATDLSRSAELF